MSRLKTISDKLDYIAMGKLNKEQMEYICEIDQEVNLKDREIERLNKDNNDLQNRFNSLMEAHKISDEENERLNSIINEIEDYVIENSLYYPEFHGKIIKVDLLLDKIRKLKTVNKPRKGEVVSLEELESYEPKNSIEEEYYDWMWS